MDTKLHINKDGTFHIKNVTNLSYTYFPLCNNKALKSSITPTLSGDTTIDQNSFLLPPTTVEDLKNSLLKRHVFFRINDTYTWNITGQSPKQILTPDRTDLYGDFLRHTIVRKSADFTCRIESFVPSIDAYQELHKITIKNTTQTPLKLKSVIGIPIFGRSADNIRDHRHVTALLNRITIVENGIINHPTFSFDERGHVLNDRHYGVFAQNSHHLKIKHYYPTLEEFIGEGQTLLDPKVVKEDVASPHQVGDTISGYEAIAGLAYETVILKPNETLSFVLSLAIGDEKHALINHHADLSDEQFERLKTQTQADWKNTLSPLAFHFPNNALNGWLKWVTLQPTLRRIYGNSFLPYHDYGRGGRGWRDLWQDLLALILMNPTPVKTMLINNFKGVRIDGSNATIIGDKPGVFLADRNNIARIWMDHGSWPFLTTKLYLDQSGDIDLLFEKTTYFQDQFTHYTKKVNPACTAKDNQLKTHQNTTYEGTILEHLLIQNLVPYYNVGKHNNIRLEDADWNDGLDMAKENGESVAFTAFYGQNLVNLSKLLSRLHEKGIETIALFEEIDTLLNPILQSDINEKKHRLKRYFDTVKDGITGKTINYDTLALKKSLLEKGLALLQHIRQNEWLEAGIDGWFNGYYDNDSKPLDDVNKKTMTLTGQVFSIMSGAASESQIQKIIASADRYLYQSTVGGYRLNTDFKAIKTNMGRLFGFAYGHKENGAMFSHMALMYANALYKRGFVKAGYKVIDSIYQQSIDIKRAKIYPGIPEYFNPQGRGMYTYLTGSASWMILTLITEVFGIKGDLGMPVFEPKLLIEQFQSSSELKIKTVIGTKPIEVVYKNPQRLNYGEYTIKDVFEDGEKVPYSKTQFGVKLHQKITGKRVEILLKESA